MELNEIKCHKTNESQKAVIKKSEFRKWLCYPRLHRGAQLCCWSTWLAAWRAPSPSPPTWTSRLSTTSSWRDATAATSSTSPRGREPRSTSLTPTARRRNPQCTFRAPSNRSAWHGSTSWCVAWLWACVRVFTPLVEKIHFNLDALFMWWTDGIGNIFLTYTDPLRCVAAIMAVIVSLTSSWYVWMMRGFEIGFGDINHDCLSGFWIALGEICLALLSTAEMSRYTAICRRLKVSLHVKRDTHICISLAWAP